MATDKVTHGRADAAQDEEGRKQQVRRLRLHRASPGHRHGVRTETELSARQLSEELFVQRLLSRWVVASFPASTHTNVSGEDVPDMQLEKRLSKEWNRQPKRGSGLRRRGRWLAHLRGKPAGPHTTPESAFSCREEAAIKGNVSESRVIIDIFLFINMIGWLNISRHLFCFCFVLFKKKNCFYFSLGSTRKLHFPVPLHWDGARWLVLTCGQTHMPRPGLAQPPGLQRCGPPISHLLWPQWEALGSRILDLCVPSHRKAAQVRFLDRKMPIGLSVERKQNETTSIGLCR